MKKTDRMFVVASDTTLCQAIAAATKRLVYIAPGISEPVVGALDELLGRLDASVVTLIIDTDPEVCRLGYGSMKGLEQLDRLVNKHRLSIRYQPGIRLGVLMCDEQMLVYTPTPLLIEAGADTGDRPNALHIDTSMTVESVARACGATSDMAASVSSVEKAEIGRQTATNHAIASSLQALKEQPPKPFDLARIERVYSSKLQYVELEVKGYRLASRRVQISNDLLVSNDKTLESRLRNSFSLLEGKETLVVKIQDADPRTGQKRLADDVEPLMVNYSESIMEDERKALIKDFLTAIPGHGQLISKARREAFDIRIEWFRDRIRQYQQAVEGRLMEEVRRSVEDLAEALLPSVMKAPPDRLLKNITTAEPGEADIRDALRKDLSEAFSVNDKFFSPSVKVVFKDLTYETIQNPAFRSQVEAIFHGVNAGCLFVEFDAAAESQR